MQVRMDGAGHGGQDESRGREPGGVSALRHNAFVYDTTEDYLSTAVTFLREGLLRGEGAVVANTRPGIAAMRDALGAQAVDVTFVDVSAAYTRPVKTLAAYHRVYAEELRRSGSLRAVADVQFGPEQDEWELWTGYESVFNRAFAHLPAWVLCSYNSATLPDPVREGIWRTHPEVVTGGGWNDSAAYDPRDHPAAPNGRRAPLSHPVEVSFTAGVEVFREDLARTLRLQGLPGTKLLDMLLATTEVLVNAADHGGGVRAVRVGRVGGRHVCEVVDAGPGFDDPTTGYLPPRPGVGAGLWVARQLTWELEFFHAREGFTARVTA
jgi:anti-sigma regulatory factor (Ser/Thr protein kinase)